MQISPFMLAGQKNQRSVPSIPVTNNSNRAPIGNFYRAS